MNRSVQPLGSLAKTGLKTLTVRASPPIRPRFLEMDMILDPRVAALSVAYSRGWQRIC
jgi:hypothetical protein